VERNWYREESSEKRVESRGWIRKNVENYLVFISGIAQGGYRTRPVFVSHEAFTKKSDLQTRITY
jgi:hypothetical protein